MAVYETVHVEKRRLLIFGDWNDTCACFGSHELGMYRNPL